VSDCGLITWQLTCRFGSGRDFQGGQKRLVRSCNTAWASPVLSSIEPCTSAFVKRIYVDRCGTACYYGQSNQNILFFHTSKALSKRLYSPVYIFYIRSNCFPEKNFFLLRRSKPNSVTIFLIFFQ